MPIEAENYWGATKHPWACVFFVLPLLATYEIGLYVTGTCTPDMMRNGADAWLRGALCEIGISPLYGAPCLLIVVLLLWGFWRRDDRPLDNVGVWPAWRRESAVFALVLLAVSQGLWHVLLRADNVFGQPSHRIAAVLQMTAATSRSSPESVWGQIVSFLGAGIYEETLFRLLLYAGLLKLIGWGQPRTSFNAVILAAFGSALLFAAAHHFGPNGDPFNASVLSFRTFAGLYFAWLFHTRGFGVAVGAHAGYDVLVGLVVARG